MSYKTQFHQCLPGLLCSLEIPRMRFMALVHHQCHNLTHENLLPFTWIIYVYLRYHDMFFLGPVLVYLHIHRVSAEEY